MSKSKKHSKSKRRTNKSKKNMKGGFSPDESQHLLDSGFLQDQIDELSNLNVTIDIINQAIEYYNNNFNAHQIILDIAKNVHLGLPPLTNIGIVNTQNEEVSGINSQPDTHLETQLEDQIDAHPNNNDISLDSTTPPALNLSDLQGHEGEDGIPQAENDNHNLDMNQSLDLSGETSVADDSMNSTMNETTNNSMNGGRRRRRYSTKKRRSNIRRNKSHRRQKGGAMYGTGYGANCNDTNFSIYNTNLTKLFPYRT